MNTKYEKYINYIVNDLEIPYFENMKDNYGLRPEEYEMVLSKLYNQPVRIKDDYVYDEQGNEIYGENSDGYWWKSEYDKEGNEIYYENSDGDWEKYEYDADGNEIYYETSDGFWEKWEYDDQDNEIYYENSNFEIRDNR